MVEEVELKLILAPRDKAALETHPIFNVSADQSEHHNLSNQYFDTPDQLLTKAGFALRVRAFGDRWVQTIKGKGTNIAGLHQRLELEWPLESPELDLSLVPSDMWPEDLVLEDIQPLFKTDFSRNQWLVSVEDDTDIEIVIDQGAVFASDDSDAISEIELELKKGNPAQLFETALKLAEQYPLVPSDVSKAERGYRLVNKTYNAWAELPVIDQKQSIERAFEQVMSYELESLQRQWEAFHYSENWKHLYNFRNTLGNIRTNFLLFHEMLTEAGTESALRSLDWLDNKMTPILNWWPACYALSKQASEQPGSVSEQLQQAKARQALVQLSQLEQQPEFGSNLLKLSRWLHQREWASHHTDKSRKKAAAPIGDAMLEPLREQWLSLQLSECGGNVSSWLERQPMIQGLTHICQTLENIFGSEMVTMRRELELLDNNLVELSSMDVITKLGGWIQELSQEEQQSINSWARSQTVVMREMNIHAQRFLQGISLTVAH